MKEYHFYRTENPLPLAVIKDSFKMYFHEMEKLLMEVIFQKWNNIVFICEKISFH